MEPQLVPLPHPLPPLRLAIPPPLKPKQESRWQAISPFVHLHVIQGSLDKNGTLTVWPSFEHFIGEPKSQREVEKKKTLVNLNP